MDTMQLEREIETQLAADAGDPMPRGNGSGNNGMPLDRLEREIHTVMELRAALKERCRTCAALIIEIERAL